MKLFLNVNGRLSHSNQFDYKIMFFLEQGFKILSSNCSFQDRDGVLYASFIKEMDENKDIEVERRILKKQMDEYLSEQRYNTFLIDVQTNKEYKKLGYDSGIADEYEQEYREQKKEIEQQIVAFLELNNKFKSVIKPHKVKYYTSLEKFLDFDGKAIGILIDDDKIKKFQQLREEGIDLKQYKSQNVLPMVSF